MIKKIIKKIVDFYFRNSVSRAGESVEDSAFRNLLQKDFKKLPQNGTINILKVYKNTNWEDPNLLPALKKIGKVIEYPMEDIDCYSLSWIFYKKRTFNKRFLAKVEELVAKKEIDIIFFYVSALLIGPKTMKEIRKLKIPTINLSFDDKVKFKAYPIPGGHSGVYDICPFITVNATSVKERLIDYYNQKAFCLFLPPAGNEDVFKKIDMIKDIDVSFVGQNYGKRGILIKYLKDNNIPIHAYGKGFDSGNLTAEQMVNIYNRSKITIGSSEISGSNYTTFKGRDFETGLCGVFYLTSYNRDLADLFIEGEEIEFYRNDDELINKINYYLANEEKRELIAMKFRKKCLMKHTWNLRFQEIFSYLR